MPAIVRGLQKWGLALEALILRRTVGVLIGSAMCLVALIPAAHANVNVTIDNVRVAPGKSGNNPANVIVTATVTQQQYADISYDVTLSGFTAKGTFAYRDGACPAKLVNYTGPGTIFQCGWVQQGKDSVLSMSIRGTFPSSTLRVMIKRGGVSTPAKPGKYDVSLSSWAFSPVITSVNIK